MHGIHTQGLADWQEDRCEDKTGRRHVHKCTDNQQEDIEQQDFYFSPMPSWKEKILSPLAKTKGYLLSAGTKYPSAANEVYRIIRSEAGIQAYIDTVDEIPAVTQVDRLENRPNLETEENEEGKESQTIEPY